MTIAINAQDVFAVIVIGLLVRIAWGQKVADRRLTAIARAIEIDVQDAKTSHFADMNTLTESVVGATRIFTNEIKADINHSREGLATGCVELDKESAKRDKALLDVMTATNALVGAAVKSAIPQDKGATLRTKMAVNDLNKMAETEALDPILIRDLLAEMGAESNG